MLTRRKFVCTSFSSMALSAMLHRDSYASPGTWAPPDGKPHFAPKAKSVIWLFMNGGVSHLETFDPKPELDKYAGKSISETPHKDVQNPEKLKLARVVVINDANGQQRTRCCSSRTSSRSRRERATPSKKNWSELPRKMASIFSTFATRSATIPTSRHSSSRINTSRTWGTGFFLPSS